MEVYWGMVNLLSAKFDIGIMKKQKKPVTYLAISFWLIAVGLFSGCAKVETTRTNIVPNNTSQSAMASDEATINSEFDQGVDDALSLICNHSATILHAFIDTSRINLGVIEISYNSAIEADLTKSRTAQDSIHVKVVGGVPVSWGTPGATASVTFGDVTDNAYEVTYLNNNVSVTLTGEAILTNISGGLLQDLTSGDSLVEQIRATVNFTYNDNATTVQLYTWHINQVRTFIKSDTTIFAITRGDTTMDGYTAIGTWGVTRFGNNFYTNTNSPVVQNISYPFYSYNPLSGSKTIEGIPQPILSTYGVNSQGKVVTSGKPYGFLINWVNGVATSGVVTYYY